MAAMRFLLVLALVASVSCTRAGESRRGDAGTSGVTTAPGSARPNLILVVLDDADAALVDASPGMQQLVARGLQFTSAFANTPLCGPARSVILSGQFAHNTSVRTNTGTQGGYEAWRAHGYDEKNLAVWLKASGYRTFLAGKYQNDFPFGQTETFIPPGWDDWHGVLSDRETSNDTFTLNDNGKVTAHRSEAGQYQTDVLRDRAVAFLEDAEKDDSRPFFMYIAPSAPHAPATPARRHAALWPDLQAPRPPSFDEADVSDKPKWLQEQGTRLTREQVVAVDAEYRGARRAIVAVEEALDVLLKTLDRLGEAENTWVMFTSDNGFHRGEHRIVDEKKSPYEESIRVPLVVWGPANVKGVKRDDLVGHVDLTPTLVDLARATPTIPSDGMSFSRLIAQPRSPAPSWRSEILIEGFGGGAPLRIPRYAALRAQDSIFIQNNQGEREYYDLRKDPHQLSNTVSALPPKTVEEIAARLTRLRDCAGEDCR